MDNSPIKLLVKHQMWRNKCINLVPSENVLSPTAKKALQNDMGQRYYFENAYIPKNNISYSYRGTKFISQLIKLGEEFAKGIFKVNFASLYPLSGHHANLGILLAFCKKGDTILCHDPFYGGYPGLAKDKLPKYLGLNVIYLPMKLSIPDMIDVEMTKALIHKKQPVLLLLSSAHTLFPIPIQELKNECIKNRCIIVYDASHPLGLIAGKQFQDPIIEGADILVGSTQKSFPGPQGGILITNKYIRNIKEIEHFVMVDNPHFHRIAALTVTLSEIKYFGDAYAEQIIKNTRHLAEKLYLQGIPVLYKNLGFTKSHMFKIDTLKNYHKFAEDLEKANIIIDNSGRIGCSEMTRFGMKETEMEKIAEFIGMVFKREDPLAIKNEVIEFRELFQEVKYCFKNDLDENLY